MAEHAGAAARPAPRRGAWWLAGHAIAAPARTFGTIAGQPAWLGVFAMVVVLNATFAWALTPYVRHFALTEVSRQLPGTTLSEARQAALEERVTAGQIVGAIVGPVAVLARLAVLSGVLWALLVVLGRYCSWRRLFVMMVYASIPIFIGQYVGYALVLLKDPSTVSGIRDLQPVIGLNALFRPENAAWNVVLGSISVFDIWYVVLITLGLEIVAGLKRSHACATSLGLWSLSAGTLAGFTLLGESLSRSIGG